MVYLENNYFKQLNTQNMTKKILQLVVVLLIAAQGVMGQTVQVVSLANATPGDIQVEVDMDGYTNVSAITLYIGFDSDLLNFTGIANTTLTGTWVANYNASIDKVIVTYTAAAGYTNSPAGKLFDLQFYNNGGFSSDITFDEPNCEIVEYLTVIPTTYTNGTVTQSASVGTVSMTALTEPIGNTVDMPVAIVGAGFTAVDAITLKIEYDETQLAYAGIANSTLTGVVASAGSGVLTINWTGTAQDFTTSVDVFDVQFVYYGGSANVEFAPGSEIASAGTALATSYVDGTVTAAAATATLTIDAVGVVPGSAVTVPIVASGFTGIQAGAVTLQVSFDNSKLTYTGYTAQQLTGWLVNANSNGEISIVCTNGAGTAITDNDLVTLNFSYDSLGGLANIVFDPGSILTSINLVTIPTTFVDGSVSGNTLGGQLTYNGNAAKEIYPATVYLRNPTTDVVMYTTATDPAGNYEFEGVANGSYYLDGTTTIDGSQAYDLSDAFDIAFIPTYTGLQSQAADVNMVGSGYDISDAFDVANSCPTISPSYTKVAAWLAPEWIFLNPVIVVSGNITVTNTEFGAICSGDANASFTPVP